MYTTLKNTSSAGKKTVKNEQWLQALKHKCYGKMTRHGNGVKNFEWSLKISCENISDTLKGTATLMITVLYMKDINKPGILIPVSSKSVEKRGNCGHLNICKQTVMEVAIL